MPRRRTESENEALVASATPGKGDPKKDKAGKCMFYYRIAI